jgi:FKBP-type peptidyl-prolyl cis-trans isomerase SlyD
MKIEKNKMVSVTYELKVADENGIFNSIEVTNESEPLLFPYGYNALLPAFEDALLGKMPGDNFEIEMDSKNGYGEIEDYKVISIPKNSFIVDGNFDSNMVKEGNWLPMMSEGQVINGLVKSINNNSVIMDFNHPLAGKNLHFTGKIIEVRDPNEEELENINKLSNHNT